MRSFYPEIDPYDTGMLDVGDGNELYYEQSGDPDGKPVVFLHGGPGGGTSPAHRRLFDPAKYRIVLFDQRGCGSSTPHASAASADLSTNTTWHLVADIERLREHLGIDRWQVFGGSWGSTLALAYSETHPERVTEIVLRGIFTLRASALVEPVEFGGAQGEDAAQHDLGHPLGMGLAYSETHPERVTEIVLRGIFTLRASELDWFYEGGASALFPDLWGGFLAPVPEAERGHLIRAYHRLLNDPDPAVHGPAGVAWATWEASTITLLPRPEVVARFAEPAYALAFARIENHYFVNKGWFEDGQLIRDAPRLRDIPAVIVQGRYDICTPAFTAWDLHEAWPEAEFRLIADAGHAFDEPGILDALIEATDRFAG